MTTTTKKTDNFVAQAGILAVAGIIVRIIGLLYRSPLTGIIGDEGNGYYGYAYNMYTIILLISSYSIPSAIAKVMAGRIALGEYNNAYRIFKCALVYVVVIGTLGMAAAFFGAPFLVVENAVDVLKIFAPTIFLSGFLGVLRGYFQAQRTMVPTSISQILEQILNAIVSIGAAYLLIYYSPIGISETKRAIRGAQGSAIGTGCGVLIALIFMLCMYMRRRPEIMRKVREDESGKVDDYRSLFKTLFFVVTPFILSTAIYNLSTSMNQTIYSKVLIGAKGIMQEQAATWYGIFSGKAIVITNIPIAFASAMAAALIPGISASFAKKDLEATIQKIKLATKVTMLISIPCGVGLFALAEPVVMLLFPQRASLPMAVGLLRALAITVVFYGLSTLSNAILQGIGKVHAPVVHAAIALVVQVVFLAGALYFTDLNLYALAGAAVIYSLLMCILNEYKIKKAIAYKQDMMRIYIKPSIAAMIMGVVAYGVYRLIALAVDIRIAMIPAFVVAIMIYFACIIKFGAVTKEEMLTFPKGHLLVRGCKVLRLLK